MQISRGAVGRIARHQQEMRLHFGDPAELNGVMSTDPAELCEPCVLQELLSPMAAAGRVAVAFAAGTDVAAAQIGHDERAPWAAPVGCLAKLLTATLACNLEEREHDVLDAGVAELLGADVEALQGVTTRHLLEHTHGLDDSLLAAPLQTRGFVAREEFLSRAGALERWTAPGLAYSYGHVGAWLVGAALERWHDRPLAALVRDEILAPREIRGTWLDEPFCAASAPGLALTAEELVRFGLRALDSNGLHAAAPITPLPGWHPLERGVCLGWKYAGSGWFGHQSVWPGASSYLRVQPRRRIALAVIAREQTAAVLALALFGARFPELFENRTQLPSEAPRAPHVTPGIYEQAARVVTVTATRQCFSAEAWQRDDRGERRGSAIHARLVPTRGVLFAQPASELVPYLQHVDGTNGAAWLWNGRGLLRRVERSSRDASISA